MQLFAQLHFPFLFLSRFQISVFPVAPADGYIYRTRNYFSDVMEMYKSLCIKYVCVSSENQVGSNIPLLWYFTGLLYLLRNLL